jgi:hypothetical protein
MKLYSCKLCHVTFHTTQGLYNHNYKTHHRNPNSSTLSNRRTGDQSKTHNTPLKDKEKLFTSHLSEHETSHHIGHVITCPVCQKGFARKRNLSLHIKNCHPEEEKFLCKTCRWGVFFKEDCKVHEKLHESNSYVCLLRVCYHNRFKGQQKDYGNLDDLLLHGDQVHMNEYKCDLCGLMCRDKFTLSAHRLSHSHTNEKPFLCKICGRGFRTKRHFKLHQETLHPDPNNKMVHSCQLCLMTFRSRHQLYTHKSKFYRSVVKP